MHVLIINGSPRIKRDSNTDKILEKFTEGMSDSGCTFEQYEISNRTQWDKIRERYYQCDNILIALPLYVECIPGLLIEFFESIEKTDNKKIAFILQSGFAEGVQLRCGEKYLKMLAGSLGCEYCGTLVKGDNFSIRLNEGADRDKITLPYKEMGKIYGRDGNFSSEECSKFTGPEIFPAPVRIMVGLLFKTVVKKTFAVKAGEWGCTRPLDDRPYTE